MPSSACGASDTVLFARFSLGRAAGADGACGEEGTLASGVGAGDGASGLIRERHWLSMSAAVGALSGRSGRAARSGRSGRGGRDPASERPSPQDGDALRSSGGPLGSRGPCLGAAPGGGERGPFLSQELKSLTLSSPSKNPFRGPRSPPASEPASKLRPMPPLSDGLLMLPPWPGKSGSGPLRLQSLISRASDLSFAVILSDETLVRISG